MISVVVCTRNRCDLLSGCLRSLAQQSLSRELYEVIVADNDSSDGTLALAKRYAEREANFRVCRELKRGANHARNAGVAIARGSYLAFIDDDALAAPEWLANIHDFIGRRPEVQVFGGPYDAHALVPIPPWFPPEYGRLSLGTGERRIEIGREWLTGTNLIVGSEAFRSVGGFHEKLGVVEKGTFYYGEETRLLVDLAAKGHAVWYSPSIRVSHLIRADKMRLRYLLRSSYLIGRNQSITFNMKRPLAQMAGSFAATAARGLTGLFAAGKGPLKRRIFYALFPLCDEIGALVERLSASLQRSDGRTEGGCACGTEANEQLKDGVKASPGAARAGREG